MGYKLAGFDVLGNLEIDPDMMARYRANLKVSREYSFHMSIQDFVKEELKAPLAELCELDVLDGSPPCSSFSMAGARERDWGKEKKFREGQALQVLDDIFFSFIDVAKVLRPKIVIAENVKGLIQGNARGYVRAIFDRFREAGYDVQLFLLNASRMGVPQTRERTFFIARRADLNLPSIDLTFNEDPISLREAFADLPEGHETQATALTPSILADYRRIRLGKKNRYYSVSIAHPDLPAPTITSYVTSSGGSVLHWEGRKFSPAEAVRIQTFPDDYDFGDLDPGYLLGMSVPPLMMKRIAEAVASCLKST